ncbi:hypothetical protein V8F20_008435 [Naviculisporaceae sp. PSN 640]
MSRHTLFFSSLFLFISPCPGSLGNTFLILGGHHVVAYSRPSIIILLGYSRLLAHSQDTQDQGTQSDETIFEPPRCLAHICAPFMRSCETDPRFVGTKVQHQKYVTNNEGQDHSQNTYKHQN